MRIAFFIDTFPKISETFILNQITGLIDRGHDVWIFAASRPTDTTQHEAVVRYALLTKVVYHNEKPANRFIRLLIGLVLVARYVVFAPRIVFNALNVVRYGREAWSLNLLFKAAAILKIGDFDIFQCHYAGNGELAVLLRGLGFRAKVVTMFHLYDLRKVVSSSGTFFPRLWKEGDLFLSISQFTTTQLEKIHVPSHKIIYHPVAADANVLQPGPRVHTPHVGIRIVTVARLVKEKNFLCAIAAVRRLVTEHHFSNILYRIVGDGDLAEELKQAAIDLRGCITFVGALSHQTVIEELNSADIFLLTSDEEILPVVLMEAQACGLPVVATDVGAVREVVADGLSGFVVPPNDAVAIADKLAFLIRRYHLRREMGDWGRSVVAEKFNIDFLNDRLVGIYQQLLKKTR